jgi:4-hydroxy-tetrahydrodipicolinate reductase
MSDASTNKNTISTKPVSLIIAGINGRMGRATIDAIKGDESIKLVGAFGRSGAAYVGKTVQEVVGAPDKNGNNLLVTDNLDKCLASLKTMPDVLIDNTEASSAVKHALAALAKGIRPVIGTSGLTESHLKELGEACDKAKIGALVVPNFSVGAILMINFAKQASRFFENVEIVETHKLGKLDAPSGTAMHTARVISEVGAELNKKFNENPIKEHELLPGSRGGYVESGVRVHSLRLPGILSKQDVYFAGLGELLTLRHESHNTKCFEQGIVIAIKAVRELNTFVLGLDNIIEEQAVG